MREMNFISKIILPINCLIEAYPCYSDVDASVCSSCAFGSTGNI